MRLDHFSLSHSLADMAGVNMSITVAFYKDGSVVKTEVVDCGNYSRNVWFLDECDAFGIKFRSEIPTDIEHLDDDYVECYPKIVCRILGHNNERMRKFSYSCYYFEKKERIYHTVGGYMVDIAFLPVDPDFVEHILSSDDESEADYVGTRKRKSETTVPVPNKLICTPNTFGESRKASVRYVQYSVKILKEWVSPVCRLCYREHEWYCDVSSDTQLWTVGDEYPRCRICKRNMFWMGRETTDPDDTTCGSDKASCSEEDEYDDDDVTDCSEEDEYDDDDDVTDCSEEDDEPDDVTSSSEEEDDVTSCSEDSTDDDETGMEGIEK